MTAAELGAAFCTLDGVEQGKALGMVIQLTYIGLYTALVNDDKTANDDTNKMAVDTAVMELITDAITELKRTPLLATLRESILSDDSEPDA